MEISRQLADVVWAGKGFRTLTHYSPQRNRKSIEKQGIVGTSKYGGNNKIFLAHKNDIKMVIGMEPNVDVYRVRIPNTTPTEKEVSPFPFIRTNIPAENVDRIGHTDNEGNLHWHKEEECPNVSK